MFDQWARKMLFVLSKNKEQELQKSNTLLFIVYLFGYRERLPHNARYVGIL